MIKYLTTCLRNLIYIKVMHRITGLRCLNCV